MLHDRGQKLTPEPQDGPGCRDDAPSVPGEHKVIHGKQSWSYDEYNVSIMENKHV